MSRDNQIEKMAKVICKSKNPDKDKDCSKCVFDCMCDIQDGCEALLDEGYRKSTDVAEEIFAETHNMLVKVMRAVDDGLAKAILTDNEQAKLVQAGTKETLRCVILALAELKKKYTEEGK